MVGPLHHSRFTHLLTFSNWLNKPINSKESSTDHDTLTCLMSAKMVNRVLHLISKILASVSSLHALDETVFTRFYFVMD